ncbi:MULTISPECIES: DUF2536 family protein [Priestia]|jgi:Protein of unknown function (DUF2536)|uniref:Uncharacterized protein n=3 Tax=Priestia TaxID=2800373 RepID=A0A0H4KMY0_9BACI|nr:MULTISPECIES: DUF2536 family protein [Priestia]AKO94226.1 hypothetical protein BEH_20285 [Priestia filamentosa]KAB2493507.1 DUF2536 family protein [Priestia endophytica]KYG36159.1 hypothetical protein AZF06_02880 [Priestia endophytica]MCM3539699.1 YrzA family protein [Priestia endophytica]MCY8233580.1 YrzA family protein [Priestia endophytica]
MGLQLQMIQDKVEFFEETSIEKLESKINEQIENNRAIFLEVHHVGHQTIVHPETGARLYTAVVHFKFKK